MPSWWKTGRAKIVHEVEIMTYLKELTDNKDSENEIIPETNQHAIVSNRCRNKQDATKKKKKKKK